jgi:hypothetical protein
LDGYYPTAIKRALTGNRRKSAPSTSKDALSKQSSSTVSVTHQQLEQRGGRDIVLALANGVIETYRIDYTNVHGSPTKPSSRSNLETSKSKSYNNSNNNNNNRNNKRQTEILKAILKVARGEVVPPGIFSGTGDWVEGWQGREIYDPDYNAMDTSESDAGGGGGDKGGMFRKVVEDVFEGLRGEGEGEGGGEGDESGWFFDGDDDDNDEDEEEEDEEEEEWGESEDEGDGMGMGEDEDEEGVRNKAKEGVEGNGAGGAVSGKEDENETKYVRDPDEEEEEGEILE